MKPQTDPTTYRRARIALLQITLAAVIFVAGPAFLVRLQTASAHQADSSSFLSPAASILQQAATPKVPVGIGTNVVPSAVSTAVAAPPVVNTSVAGVSGNAQPGQPTPADSLPWLIVALVLVVALVVVGAVAAMRRPKAPVLATSQVAPGADVAIAAPQEPVEPYVPAAEQVTAPVAPVIPIATAAEGPVMEAPVTAPVTAPVAPVTIECPNCGAVNNIDENFCHDCGQDLRPQRASTVATAPVLAETPAEGVAVAAEVDETPYLETLDRTDEQLEFVLSRPHVAMGTAPDNDIVIDSAYRGWETVSEHHAELQREQDGFMIVDRDSQNGTFVNEMRTGENIISNGDNLRLGDVHFIFRVPPTE